MHKVPTRITCTTVYHILLVFLRSLVAVDCVEFRTRGELLIVVLLHVSGKHTPKTPGLLRARDAVRKCPVVADLYMPSAANLHHCKRDVRSGQHLQADI